MIKIDHCTAGRQCLQHYKQGCRREFIAQEVSLNFLIPVLVIGPPLAMNAVMNTVTGNFRHQAMERQSIFLRRHGIGYTFKI
uniref:Uncharacterized protein n=1 Tax=Romanomermis culicivorax TaxID=13658 RepID=A0A915K1S5_ROMCU